MKNKKPQVFKTDIKLIPSRGTKDRGGGKDGESWRIEYKDRSSNQISFKKAGQVFINLIENSDIGKHASIQIHLNLQSQGRGIGTIALKLACEQSQYDTIYAHIRKSNIASIRASEKAGFKDKTTSKDRQKIMVWTKK